MSEEQLAGLSQALRDAATILRARADLVEAVQDVRQDRTKPAVEKVHSALEAVLHECCSYMASHSLFPQEESPTDIRRLKFIDYMKLIEKRLLVRQERSDFYHYNDVRVAAKHGSGVEPHPREAKGFVAAVEGFMKRLGLGADWQGWDSAMTRAALVQRLPPPKERRPLFDMERQMLTEALSKAGGNKTKAAKLLGISRRQVYTKLARYGIPLDEGCV